ncbi:MAG: cob(I)yrinic acid a,c-diamide adenosyltransferase [Chloroflexota bacterium]|nr:cob(I)yrinic acid a,c-diamide adenosyltransferase [Chloroflexota bacterium]
MPRIARVTTRTGDSGETSLFGKGRVRKTDPRVVALGDLDEAQSALGLARASVPLAERDIVLELQRGLYRVMAEVATPSADLPRLRERIDADAVASIDALIAGLRERAGVEGRFVVPGEDVPSATLDVARTVVRRAERSVVGLADATLVDGTHLVPWLNRLSDVVYLLARALESARTEASSAPPGRSPR